MKKIGVLAVLFSMLLCIPPVSCASADPCEELDTKGNECCAKAPDDMMKATCNAGFDAVVKADSHDACEAVVKDFKCNF